MRTSPRKQRKKAFDFLIGVVGAGHMGSILMDRLRPWGSILFCEKNPRQRQRWARRPGVRACSLEDLLARSRLVIMAVKPQDLDSVMVAAKPHWRAFHQIISIAAGVPTRYFEKNVERPIAVVRAMPNLPARLGQGVTALCGGRYAGKTHRQRAQKIFASLGEVVWVEENKMDAVTAVSGSGPAYVFAFVEAWLAAARACGLSQREAEVGVKATLSGSVALMKESPLTPGQLREQVTSQGGTTWAALETLRAGGWAKVFAQAIKAAQRRARELSRPG